MCVRRAHTMYKNYTLTFETSHSWKNQELHRQHQRMDTRISQYDTASIMSFFEIQSLTSRFAFIDLLPYLILLFENQNRPHR